MILKEYLEKNKITQKEFAKMTGYSKANVSKLVKRIINPSFEKAELIYKITRKKVSFLELKKIQQPTVIK